MLFNYAQHYLCNKANIVFLINYNNNLQLPTIVGFCKYSTCIQSSNCRLANLAKYLLASPRLTYNAEPIINTLLFLPVNKFHPENSQNARNVAAFTTANRGTLSEKNSWRI